jgi:hypothetical protein
MTRITKRAERLEGRFAAVAWSMAGRRQDGVT